MFLVRVLLGFVAASAFTSTAAADPAEADALAHRPPAIRTFTADGAWCWFSAPPAVRHQGRLLAGWITSDGSVQVGSRPLDQPDAAASADATAITTLAPQFERDDHDHPAFLNLPNGDLLAFFSPHAHGDMLSARTHRRPPDDALTWSSPQPLGFADPSRGQRGTTYANPFLLSDEANTIYLFWRGNDFKPTFATSPDLGVTWTAPQTLISETGRGTDNRPYVKYCSDGRGRIDFIFTDGHPRNEPTNSVYYARYEHGAFWRADGSRIAGLDELPLQPSQCDRVYDGATAGRAWVWSVAVDLTGAPVLAYTRLPSETDHRYHYARWDGSTWQDHAIVAAGAWFPHPPPGTVEREPHYSGGIALDPQHPSTVYLSRPIQGVFEIERWTTPTGGATWTHTALTTHSPADNVRPYVVNGAPSDDPVVMWMQNRGGYTHYTDFHTEIHYLRLPAIPAAHP